MDRLQEKNGDGMNYNEEIILTFDRYSEGQMSPEEKRDFEKTLLSDSDLNAAFEEYRQLRTGIRNYGYNRFSDTIRGWEEELANEDSKVVQMNRTWYLVAAAVSVLVLSVIGLLQFSGERGTEKVFASYYQPYPDILTDRGSGKQLLNEGLYQYESGNYPTAIEDLRQYVAEHRSHKEVYFYLAQAYLANNETSKAVDIFNSLHNEEGFKLKEANDWYRALAYLKIDNVRTAKEILQLIKRDDNHAYRERSQKLLEELN